MYMLQASEMASLCDGRLERKSSELHRNGKGDQAYLSEKSTIQCLVDVKVVRSKYEDTK